MSYPTHDTDWAESAKGNHWRRENGKARQEHRVPLQPQPSGKESV